MRYTDAWRHRNASVVSSSLHKSTTLQYTMAVLLSAVIDHDFVIHNLHLTPPLILIVLSSLDRGIQSAMEMLPSLVKAGEGVAHTFNCTPVC